MNMGVSRRRRAKYGCRDVAGIVPVRLETVAVHNAADCSRVVYEDTSRYYKLCRLGLNDHTLLTHLTHLRSVISTRMHSLHRCFPMKTVWFRARFLEATVVDVLNKSPTSALAGSR
jgi:hypothetical protein